MDPPSSSQTDDEWELCNDDGFIYKRRKCRHVLTEQQPVPADPDEEQIRRREWKRKNLLRVKEKYKKEIEEWEIMLETLKAMQDKASGFQIQQQERRKSRETEEEHRTASSSGSEKKDNASGSLVDELLSQIESSITSTKPLKCKSLLGFRVSSTPGFEVFFNHLELQAEAQEMVIRDVSNLCDIAEAICNAQEHRLNQTYLDLPIWASPHHLMASLCDE